MKKYRYSSKNKNIVRWLKMLSDDYFYENAISPIPRFPRENRYINAAKKQERGIYHECCELETRFLNCFSCILY